MRTCTLCHELHIGECAYDEAKADLLHAAETHGWQSCSKCQAMVELDTDCNHITC